jgi:quercetin dioxygenase-like cupin family protein
MSFKARDFAVGPHDSLWGSDDPLPGTNMQLLAGAGQTDGQFSVVRYTITTEVYTHIHELEDESIYLLDGEITVTVGDNTYDLEPGAFIFMPKGIPHSIVPRSESWRGLTVSVPGGPFQDCMEELLAFQKAGNQLTPEAMIEIQGKHGVRNVSPEDKWYEFKDR